MKAELLYEEYRKTRADTVRNARIVHFPAESGTDTFNPSIPFDDRGAKKIAVRAAPRGLCRSEIRYYEITDKGYVPVTGPRLDLEDPFVTRIGGELVLAAYGCFSTRARKTAVIISAGRRIFIGANRCEN